MQNIAVDFDTIIQQFNAGHAWWQLGVVAAGFTLGWAIAGLIRAIRELMSPPEPKKKRPIGFSPWEEK